MHQVRQEKDELGKTFNQEEYNQALNVFKQSK